MTTPNTEAKQVPTMMAEAALSAPPTPPPIDAYDVVRASRARSASILAILKQDGPALFDVSDLAFAQNGLTIVLRIYRPAEGALPAVLYPHGGSFTCTSIGDYDAALRRLAQETGWAVVAVEYRLSPEHPYPAGLEDCYSALCHIAAEAGALGLEASRLVVAGDSAGGLLAAATTLMARDKSGPVLAGMMCLYPSTDLREDSGYPSRTTHNGKLTFIRDCNDGERHLEVWVTDYPHLQNATRPARPTKQYFKDSLPLKP